METVVIVVNGIPFWITNYLNKVLVGTVLITVNSHRSLIYTMLSNEQLLASLSALTHTHINEHEQEVVDAKLRFFVLQVGLHCRKPSWLPCFSCRLLFSFESSNINIIPPHCLISDSMLAFQSSRGLVGVTDSTQRERQVLNLTYTLGSVF